MRHIYITVLMLIISLSIWAQGEKRQVRITTPIEEVSVALFNSRGESVSIGKTPFLASLMVDSIYTYHIRHRECHPDSGQLHIDVSTTELVVPVRPYRIQVSWKVNPEDAVFRFVPLKSKAKPIDGLTSEPTVVNAGSYRLSVRSPHYRQYRQTFQFNSDSAIIVCKDLQYCPPRLIVALNLGLGSEGCLPLGITMAYGGVHGIYGRYVQTWFNRATGDDFDTNTLIDVLTNPYTDQAAEYLSFVAGYQYLTPMGLYLQGGLGYGSQHFNWHSSEDGERHRFEPDSSSGLILDLGIGYTFGRYYAGAAFQTMRGGSQTFSPACMMINLGICL